MRLGDAEYQAIIDQVLAYDLTGYDVYLMGSIIRGKANDLDVVIVGPWDYERLRALFEPLSGIDRLDLYYSDEPPLAYSHGDWPSRQLSVQWIGENANPRIQSRGQLLDGFLQRHFTIPNGKAKTLKHEYAEPILLVQNGEQVYF